MDALKPMRQRSIQLNIPFDREVIERIRDEAGIENESSRGRGRPIYAPVLERMDDSELVDRLRLSVPDINLDDPWTERERNAWAPPEDLKVSEWAEQYRMLPSKTSAAPGRWSNIPFYTVEVMDSFTDPWVETITVMAAVQSSKTESIYNMLGFAVCQDPAPVLVVMPTLGLLKRANRKILNMIRESPEMASHITSNPDDVTKSEIQLDNLCITFATAGSTADLRNVEVRYCLMDETDDYPLEVSEQGSPIEMAAARTTTFWNRKIIHTCTPTTDEGYIAQEYARSDQSKYWVPCPHCRGYQKLDFFRVKHRGTTLGQWPKDLRNPDYIRSNRVARYECEHCGSEIDDRDKRWMLRFGTWVPDGHPIEKDGTVEIPRPRSIHRGFHWSALYSPWRSFSDIAAQFFKTKGDPETYKTFVNLWLGEPWVSHTQDRSETAILALRDERPRGLVPSEGVIGLTAGIDTQDNGFYYTVRAWGEFDTSWLIAEGFIDDFDTLLSIILGRFKSVDGSDYVVNLALQDAMGHRTAEVYEKLRGLNQIRPTKGEQRMAMPYSVTRIDTYPGTNKPILGGLSLYRINTTHFKDKLHSKLGISHGDPGAFHLHSETSEDYARQMVTEFRNDKGLWECPKNRPNHYWDCETLAMAAADILGIKHWVVTDVPQATPSEQRHEPRPQKRSNKARRW